MSHNNIIHQSKTSDHLHKDKDHRKNIRGIFFGKLFFLVKSSWNKIVQINKKLILCYNLWAKNTRFPQGDKEHP